MISSGVAGGAPSHGDVMRALRGDILAEWRHVLEPLAGSRRLDRTALVDTLPELLDRITELTDTLGDDAEERPGVIELDEHALVRLREGFDLGEIVTEFALLRQAVLRVWARSEGPHDLAWGRAVNRAIDVAVSEVVDAYLRSAAESEQHVLRAEAEARAAELERSERRFRTLAEASVDVIWTADPHGRIVEDAPLWRAFTGQSWEELHGSGWLDAVHPEDRARVAEVSRRAIAERGASEAQLRVRRPDGSYTWVHARGVPIVEADGAVSGWVGSMRDVSERRRAWAAVEAHVAQHAAVARLGLRAVGSERLEALFQAAVEEVATTLRTELVMIGESVAGQPQVRLVAGVGWRAGVVGETVLEPGRRSQSGHALQSGESVVAEDFDRETRFVAAAVVSAHGARSGITVLVRVRGERPFGVLSAFSRRPRAFSADDVHFVQSVANVLGAAIEEHRADARLRESEERFAFLAEASHVLSTTLDVDATIARLAGLLVPRLADWCVIEVVHADRAPSVAYQHRDPTKRSLGERLHTLLRPNAARGIARVLRTGQPELHPEIDPGLLDELFGGAGEGPELVRRLGIRAALTVPIISRGKVLGALSLATAEEWGRALDRRDLALAEEIARRAGLALDNASLYEEAQRSIRLRDDIVGIVSHDLKSPLNGIVLAAALLDRALPDDAVPPRRQVALIQRSAARMDRLIRDLLDMAQLRAGRLSLRRERIDAAAILDEALALELNAADEKRVVLARDGDRPSVTLECDRDRVGQVLSNLVGNALKFTPPGGRVTACVAADGGEVRYTIADTGPGIPEADLPRVFEPYWTKGARKTGGTGLGLFIARGIVEAHGGRIWVESAPGQGSTFGFALPLGPARA